MINILHFSELESTNKYAKEAAKNGKPEFTVIIADRQSEGYGRMGRSFCSPGRCGLYMSVILRPKIKPCDSLLITTAAAVAVSRAIESIADVKAGIKWVNDIYIDNKKVCGILTEAAFGGGDNLDHVILGIGVNLTEPKEGYPDEIKDIAAAIFPSPKDSSIRDELARLIIDNFKVYYNNLENKAFLGEYKERNIVIGKDVTVIRGNARYTAHVMDIDDELRLIVKDENKNITALDSGEISIRM